jgi:predicted nucleotide-binding protein
MRATTEIDRQEGANQSPIDAGQIGIVSNQMTVLWSLKAQREAALLSLGGLAGCTTVFLVHGRNHGQRETVARFLEKLGLKVILLDEHAGVGLTIVENLERAAGDAGFAIVLLTGDDVGGLKGTKTEEQCVRARQNVILELGYFLGRLGRERVCALYEVGVEIPTDFLGVRYVKLEEEAWKLPLARELKKAGFQVDLNRAL